MDDFNPNNTAKQNEGVFGLPYSLDESKVAIIPVPWDLTASYGKGTSKGPRAILNESPQIDLYDLDFKNSYNAGIHLIKENANIYELGKSLDKDYLSLLSQIDQGLAESEAAKKYIETINEASDQVNKYVYNTSKDLITNNKIPAVLGGEHSAPYGLIKALTEQHGDNFSILHIDAHADLREAYQGITHSHASIMYNVLQLENSPNLMQVGIRDFCEDEFKIIEESSKIHCLFDREIKENMYHQISWSNISEQILENLKDKVYISFDIDGLNPSLCPNTGTPVPGGLDFEQAQFLVKLVAEQKQIIGFDLCEVAPGSNNSTNIDAIIGTRILYFLSCAAIYSERKKS